MIDPKTILRKFLAIGRGSSSPRKIRRTRRAPLAIESLEGRLVLSTISVGLGFPTGTPITLTGSGTNSTGSTSQTGFGGFGGGPGGFGGGFGGGHGGGPGGGPGGVGGFCGPGGPGNGTPSVLGQDARLVQQAFQTFDSAYLTAVAALRATATTTTAPTAAGLTAFNTAIASAVSTLDASVASDLANLTNTGTALVATVDGDTAALQAELDSAATGLANSTNASVVALNQEANTYLRSAGGQITSAILNDTATGTITSSTVQTYKQAAQTAYQAFNTAISNAEQTSISGGTSLSASVIDSAVSTLQTALTSAISGVGTGFTTSTYDPTAAVTTDLNNLDTALKAIAAPTASSTVSARLFLQTVNKTLMQYESLIEQTVSTAIGKYNSSLL